MIHHNGWAGMDEVGGGRSEYDQISAIDLCSDFHTSIARSLHDMLRARQECILLFLLTTIAIMLIHETRTLASERCTLRRVWKRGCDAEARSTILRLFAIA